MWNIDLKVIPPIITFDSFADKEDFLERVIKIRSFAYDEVKSIFEILENIIIDSGDALSLSINKPVAEKIEILNWKNLIAEIDSAKISDLTYDTMVENLSIFAENWLKFQRHISDNIENRLNEVLKEVFEERIHISFRFFGSPAQYVTIVITWKDGSYIEEWFSKYLLEVILKDLFIYTIVYGDYPDKKKSYIYGVLSTEDLSLDQLQDLTWEFWKQKFNRNI